MIHIKKCTPIPALLVCVSIVVLILYPTYGKGRGDHFHITIFLQCIATIFILCIGETHNLINYVSFINYLSYGVTIAGLIYLRKKKPHLARPIKV